MNKRYLHFCFIATTAIILALLPFHRNSESSKVKQNEPYKSKEQLSEIRRNTLSSVDNRKILQTSIEKKEIESLKTWYS